MVNFLGATALLLIAIGTRPALAQEATPSERSLESQEKKEQPSPEAGANSAPSIVSSQQEAQPEEKKKLGGAGSIVVAPLPISSPAVGSGIVPVVAYIFPLSGKDQISPFYGNCIFGTDNQLPGYVAGQYFTRYALATQVEYRLVLPKRFGLVAFGGVGEVIPGEGQVFGQQKFLPSVGGGLRFQLSKKYHVNLRADIAQGRDGHTFGLGIGEAF